MCEAIGQFSFTVNINQNKVTMSKEPKGSKPKNIHVVRDTLSVRHDFTQAERNEITDQLTKAVTTKIDLENQLSAVKKDFASKIDLAIAVICSSTGSLTSNYEMRTTDVEITFNRKKGIKTIKHFCPGKPNHLKVISEEDMTPGDFQRLPMEIPKTDKDKAPVDDTKPVKLKKSEARAIANAIKSNQVPGVTMTVINPGDGQ